MRIVITGASGGVGHDAALALAAHPDNHLLVLSRNAERLKKLQEEVLQQHRNFNFHILPFDLNHWRENELGQSIESLGGVDILINNAGLLINKPFRDLSQEDWDAVFSTNFFAPIHLIRFLLPWLEKSTAAHIVNISSMGGFQGSSKFPGLSAYSSSKAAVANLTECLAEEFKEKNIVVNCLALGAVQTEMLNQAFPGYKAPLTSTDMGEFLAWFAIEGRRFFNGKILPISSSTP